jgi:hypothetical protein
LAELFNTKSCRVCQGIVWGKLGAMAYIDKERLPVGVRKNTIGLTLQSFYLLPFLCLNDNYTVVA